MQKVLPAQAHKCLDGSRPLCKVVRIAVKEKDIAKLNTEDASDTVIAETPSKRQRRKNYYRIQKIQLFLAALFTASIIVIAPSLAWFSYQKEMAVSTKINSPATLEIKSGGHAGAEQDIINFELSDIDTESKSYPHYEESGTTYYYKDYVFCVKGKAISAYDLQIAHTTNIAFKYQVFRAIQDDTYGTIQYVSKDKSVTQMYRLARVKLDVSGNVVTQDSAVVYEDYSTPIDGRYINNANSDGRTLANSSLTARSYDTDTDTYQVFANPVYWLKRDIPVYTEEKTDDGFTHSYVLRISWVMKSNNDDVNDLDVVQNNKETDMIYITAAVH